MEPDIQETTSPFSNKTYDMLKFVAQILLPGLGALYFGLAQIWGLPKAEEVVGTVAVIDTFLGLLLGLSSKAYKEEVQGKVVGTLDVHEGEDGKKMMTLNFPGNPYDIENHNKVAFKVRKR